MSETDPAEPQTRFPVGYARVSMEDQDNARQIEELTRFGVHPDDIFTDKASGANMDRPGWQALWKDIREGDTVVILSLDRLGRDVLQILQTVEAMKERGVKLKVLIGGLDFATPIGRFVFTVMAGFAQLERELIHERTMHGLAKARERGTIGGRPVRINAEVIADTLARMANREPLKAIAAHHGVSEGGLKKALDRHRKQHRMRGSEHDPA